MFSDNSLYRTKMKLILLLVAFGLNSCGCEPEDSYCCNPEQSVLNEVENFCVDINNNTIKTPAKLACVNITVASENEFNYTITDDGRIIVLMDELEPHIDGDVFCVANRTLNINERVIVFCDEVEEEQFIDERILAYCMYVSVVFLILTLIVYCALPELRDLQGKSLINFCGSLAIGLSILGVLRLSIGYSHMGLCAARGFFTYFFIMTSFFWTNAISIQILRNIRRPSRYDYGWKEFIWYALYAWGCPAFITVSMVIANFVPGNHRKPGIGLNNCWFFSSRYQWQYMYSIMTILIVANISIFFYVSTHLCRHSFASSHIKALKYKFVMTVRMFIVMGLPWVFEMISSLSGPHVVWIITDIFNTLQGLLIFLLLVVFRKRVIKAMFKRGWLDCIAGFVERHLAVGDDDEEDVMHETINVDLREEFTK